MSQLIPYNQETFKGGINLQFDPSKIGEDEYPLLMNGRVRKDIIETIQLPEDLSSQIPEGKKQGIVSAGVYIVAFVSGKAYYKNVADPSIIGFTQVLDLQLDPDVDFIYAELVPASTINHIRKLLDESNVKSGVSLSDTTLPSPNGLVVMDGINQAWIMFQDGTARVTLDYVGWTMTDREYVPIGVYPVFYDGILYCAGKDTNGKLNQILRSVTGRPLDFMVKITNAGDKSSEDESTGGASSVSGRADYNTLTCLSKISSTDKVFFASTLNNSYFIVPVLTSDSPFSEPTFNYQWLFNTGPLNNFSLVEVLGDTLFIDLKGIVSFNATQQIKFRGNNAPFSARINSLFEIRPNEYITQSITCAAKLNNYAYFACNTIYGPSVLVYDELLQKFVSVDQWDLGSGVFIKQFCVIATNTENRLFFITSDDRLMEAFRSTETASCKVYLGDWSPQSPNGQHKLIGATVMFSDTESTGSASVSCYVDGKLCGDPVTNPLEITFIRPTLPTTPPFGPSSQEQENVPLSFGFDSVSLVGQHIGIWVEWNVRSILHEVTLVFEDYSTVVSQQQEVIDQN